MGTQKLNPIIERVMEHWSALEAAALRHGLRPHLLAGLVATESGGDAWAVRAEPGYRWLVGDDPGEPDTRPPLSTQATEWATQRISWGLCQVMGATAREMGFRGWLSRLVEPEINLEIGAKYLALCIKRAQGVIEMGLSRYNGGGDRNYPERVLGWANRLGIVNLAGDAPGEKKE